MMFDLKIDQELSNLEAGRKAGSTSTCPPNALRRTGMRCHTSNPTSASQQQGWRKLGAPAWEERGRKHSGLLPMKVGRARLSLCSQILVLVGTEALLVIFQGVTSDPRLGMCGWFGQPLPWKPLTTPSMTVQASRSIKKPREAYVLTRLSM